jgi:hypothetical protein
MAQLGVRRMILERSLVVAKDMTSMSLYGLLYGILNMSMVHYIMGQTHDVATNTVLEAIAPLATQVEL